MRSHSQNSASSFGKKLLLSLGGPLLLVLAGFLAYSNSFAVPFVHDDIVNIVENTSIRNPDSLASAFRPPQGTGVYNRPIVNASLAANYALSGLNPSSYHALNLAVHLLCALVLFGLLETTFASPRMAPLFGKASRGLALASALIWVVHPLNTQSVTYVIQRAESLMALFYLLTLYCAARGFFSPRRGIWHAGAILAFVTGFQVKEVIVTAPAVIFLYDLTFAGGGILRALRRSALLYLGLACATGLRLYQMGSQIGTQSLASAKSNYFTRNEYLLSQPRALLHYLRLSLLPLGLTFDYWARAQPPGEALPYIAAIALLAALTAWGLVRRNPAAFALACFFLILLPSSSVYPLNTLMSEHRMYLPLAALMALLVGGFYRAACALPERAAAAARAAGAVLACLAVLGLGFLTFERNRVYRSTESLWQDTLDKRPENPRAMDCLGNLAQEAGESARAFRLHQAALALAPDVPYFNYNMANWYLSQQQPDKALHYYNRALELWPGFRQARINMATALAMSGDFGGAAGLYATAMEGGGEDEGIRKNLARVLSESRGDVDALVAVFSRVRTSPDLCLLVGTLMVNSGRWEVGLSYLARAQGLAPGDQALADKLAKARAMVADQAEQGIARERARLARAPENPAPLLTMSLWYQAVGNQDAAEESLRRALLMNPELSDAKNDLALVLIKKAGAGPKDQGRKRIAEAEALLASVLARHPGSLVAHYNMACLRARQGRREEALAELGRAVDLGLSDAFSLITDPDLASLADEPGFLDLVRKAAARNKRCKPEGREETPAPNKP